MQVTGKAGEAGNAGDQQDPLGTLKGALAGPALRKEERPIYGSFFRYV